MKTKKIIEKIKQRIEELEEIARGSKLDWEQVIYDKKYEITLCRDYYTEDGFYLVVEKHDENAAVSLEELPENILEETLEILYFPEIEEAIEETLHED